MTDPFSWMLARPEVPAWSGPSRVHIIYDDEPVSTRRPAMVAGPELMARAAATVAKPARRDDHGQQRTYAQRKLEESAAARGEKFLPLQPGQKRRRRAGPDGKPLKRAGRGKRGGAGYVRTASAPPPPAAPAEPAYKGPVRAPGEMTYGQAARLIHRANDGDLVDLEELCRAHDVVRQARESETDPCTA